MGIHCRLFAVLSAIVVLAVGAPSPCSAQVVKDCGGRLVAFDFVDQVDGVTYESVVLPQDQANFISAFCVEVAKVEKWFLDQKWLKSPVAPRQALGSYAPQQVFELNDVDLRVSVSQQNAISRAVLPAAEGRRGAMEFPAREVNPLTAGIAHELTHLYFPNGNRFLDEGFATYLQNKIGTNPALPDYQHDLHALMLKLACEIDSDVNSSPSPTPAGGLDQISVVELERAVTPTPLVLQLTSKPVVAAFIVAGSFVRFLIDSYGLDTFHDLYVMTPLKPLHRDGGTPDRWKLPYGGLSLGDLENKWKMSFSAAPCP
jgi:hypothetical protein